MAHPLSRTRWLQLFCGPGKQTFCLLLFWVRKPPRGRREAEQAWPFLGRAAEGVVQTPPPRVLGNKSECQKSTTAELRVQISCPISDEITELLTVAPSSPLAI